jgi:hypothetical protein
MGSSRGVKFYVYLPKNNRYGNFIRRTSFITYQRRDVIYMHHISQLGSSHHSSYMTDRKGRADPCSITVCTAHPRATTPPPPPPRCSRQHIRPLSTSSSRVTSAATASTLAAAAAQGLVHYAQTVRE